MYKNKLFLSVACLCWVVLITQYVIMIQNRVVSIPQTTLRFFSFFTILTNILVALVFSAAFCKDNKFVSFLKKPATQTAVAVYILIVGLVYNIILRFLWKPQGLQRIVDEFLHLIIPLFYVLIWFFKVQKSSKSWNLVFKWLLYPLVYVSCILVLGHFSKFYPYPFIDVAKLGYEIVFRNIVLLFVFFAAMSTIFIWISKLQNKTE